jgi:hypothetical protein
MAGLSGEFEMNTRIEMIYDFMIALSSNSHILLSSDEADFSEKQAAAMIYKMAEALTNEYFEHLA